MKHIKFSKIIIRILLILSIIVIPFSFNNTYAYFTNGGEIITPVSSVSINYKDNIKYDTVSSSKDTLTIYFDNSKNLWQEQCLSYGIYKDSNINNANNFVGWPGVRMMLAKPINEDGSNKEGLWVSYTITGSELERIRENGGGYFKINNSGEVQFPDGPSNWFEINKNDTEIYVNSEGKLFSAVEDNDNNDYDGVKIYYKSTTDTKLYIWNNNGNLSNWPGVLGTKVMVGDEEYSMIEIKDKWYNTKLIDNTYFCGVVLYFPDTGKQSTNIYLPSNVKEAFYVGNKGKYTLDETLTKYYD